MTLHRLQHVLIQTRDITSTVAWYVDVLGMREGPHPDFKFPVAWLYIGDEDVLHITEGGAGVTENRMRYLGQQSTETQGSGVIDHIAFRATGLRQMLEALRTKGIAFTKRQVDGQGLFQLFLIDPNGVKVELNFDSSEASGVAPDLMASSLAG